MNSLEQFFKLADEVKAYDEGDHIYLICGYPATQEEINMVSSGKMTPAEFRRMKEKEQVASATASVMEVGEAIYYPRKTNE